MKKFAAACLAMLALNLPTQAHAGSMTPECERHATNLLSLLPFFFTCETDDDVFAADEAAFMAMEKKAEQSCSGVDENEIERIADRSFSKVKALTTDAERERYCKATTKQIKNIAKQYK